MSEQREISWFWGGFMLFLIVIHMGIIEGKLDRIANALEAIAKAGQ